MKGKKYNTNELGQIVLVRRKAERPEEDKYMIELMNKTMDFNYQLLRFNFPVYALPTMSTVTYAPYTEQTMLEDGYSKEDVDACKKYLRSQRFTGFHLRYDIFVFVDRIVNNLINDMIEGSDSNGILKYHNNDFAKCFIHYLSVVYFHEVYHLKDMGESSVPKRFKQSAFRKANGISPEAEDYAIKNSNEFVWKHIDHIIEEVLGLEE